MPRAVRVCSLLCVALPTSLAPGQTIIVDNADPAFIVLSGTWNTGAYGSPYGLD